MKKLLHSTPCRLFVIGVFLGATPTLLVMAIHGSAPADNHSFVLGMLIYLVAIVPIQIESAKLPDALHQVKIDTILELALLYNSMIGGVLLGVLGMVITIVERRK